MMSFHTLNLRKAYGDMAFFKVDMVMLVNSKSFETSCVYKITNGDILNRENFMKNTKEDIEECKAKGFLAKY